MDRKIRHLEMIQKIISRMAGNSFYLKGWSVTLIAGIFALASKDTNKTYFLIAYIPVIIFWFIDSYYLQQERLFRKLYDFVRNIDETKIDFSMNISHIEFKDQYTQYSACFLSITELWFYLPLAILATGVVIISIL